VLPERENPDAILSPERVESGGEEVGKIREEAGAPAHGAGGDVEEDPALGPSRGGPPRRIEGREDEGEEREGVEEAPAIHRRPRAGSAELVAGRSLRLDSGHASIRRFARIEEVGMNKAELVDQVRQALGEGNTRAEAQRALEAVLSGIEAGLKKDGAVSLVGFGSFSVRRRGPRMGRNPRTGEEIRIGASRTVAFRAGVELKAKV
jgi:nucleoid DNA-binding protein